MGVAEAQAYYDDTGGAGSGFVSAQDAKDAIGVIYTDMDAAIPTGVVWAYAGATAPAGWHLCDGTAHGSSALQTLIGSANAPDLRDRFVIGAGAGHSLNGPHGSGQITVGSANLPPHSHSVSITTGDNDQNHNHGPGTLGTDTEPAHDHGLVALQDNELGPDDARRVTGGTGNISDRTALGGAHSHAVTTGATGNQSTNHKHSVIGNTGNGPGTTAPITVDPPSYALTYIIKL